MTGDVSQPSDPAYQSFQRGLSAEQLKEYAQLRAQRSETRRATVPALEDVLYTPLPVLDRGFVRVVDYMGDDGAVVQAARVSYGRGTKKISEDRGLINYLMRHRHSTPFEMCEIKFHVKLPIFVARQWIRHRTANVNEYSARYSVLDKEFYVPDNSVLSELKKELKDARRNKKRFEKSDDLFGADKGDQSEIAKLSGGTALVPSGVGLSAVAAQSRENRQGRGEVLGEGEAREIMRTLSSESARAYTQYLKLLNQDDAGQILDETKVGLTRELARTVLPVNFYTQWYWKVDLHNLMHFLSLRADVHAQYEIRVYAEAMLDVMRRWVPLCHEAFLQHRLHAVTLSAAALAAVKRMIAGEKLTQESSGIGQREWREFVAALGLLE
jgi:thymidylate synthase (FAD)